MAKKALTSFEKKLQAIETDEGLGSLDEATKEDVREVRAILEEMKQGDISPARRQHLLFRISIIKQRQNDLSLNGGSNESKGH